MLSPINVVSLYDPKDRRLYMDKLRPHLDTLEQQGLIEHVYAEKLKPGEHEAQTYDLWIRKAKVCLCFLSAHFFSNPDCLRRTQVARENNISILPIMAKRVETRGTPLQGISVLDLSAANLSSSIYDFFSDLQERLGTSEEKLSTDIEYLAALSQTTFRTEIAEPLLRILKFRDLREIAQPALKGLLLSANKRNEFGRIDMVIIYVRNFDPAERLAKESIGRQLLDEHGIISHKYTADRYLLISTEILNNNLIPVRGLEVIDGVLLLDLIAEHLPHALVRLPLESRYRRRLSTQVNVITESQVAFERNSPLLLENIFVEMTLNQTGISSLLHSSAVDVIQVSEDEFFRFVELVQRWGGSMSVKIQKMVQSIQSRRENQKTTKVKRKKSLSAKPAIEEETRTVNISCSALAAPVGSKIENYLKSLNRLANEHTSLDEDQCSAILREGIQLSKDINELTEDSLFNRIWKQIQKLDYEVEIPVVPCSFLLKTKEHIHIFGGPGAGKTTTVRWLTRSWSADPASAIVPIFVPLVSVRGSTPEAIVDACAVEFSNHLSGEENTAVCQKVKELLENGKCRLILDGLDETGERASQMMDAIKKFSKIYPCQIILTTRNTFRIQPWEDAFVLELNRLSDSQLSSFIRNWFSSEGSSERTLNEWLDSNSYVKELARTPMIAALLCSLYSVGAELPSTELDLYDRRFDLLLGRWDRAKGLVPIPSELRQNYRHFLMALAIYLHKKETRTASQDEIYLYAKKYRSKKIRDTPLVMIEDCLRRGLLEKGDDGSYSFGHLTYQEFLAACWLSENNPLDFIWSKLKSSWWSKVLDFYAAKKLDISSLISFGTKYRSESEILFRLTELQKLAHLTPEEVLARYARDEPNRLRNPSSSTGGRDRVRR